MQEALDIQIKGIVQGVGFRPFVFRTARSYQVTGWVLNAVDGVFIHAEGDSALLDQFVLELAERPPQAAVVKSVEMKEVPLQGFTDFTIRFSDDADVEETTLVSPDLATCDACVAELFDPTNRRYRYPFINCTDCGPRFTIIDHLPYDRAATSMASFDMCPPCESEYRDPADRRFHAQPDACFDCGPQICWFAAEGQDAPGMDKVVAAGARVDETGVAWACDRTSSDAILAAAVDALKAGKILAVKGLGGYHLVCDAGNEQTIAELRRRKRREGKAFACMVANVDEARALCQVNREEAATLKLPARPIVLLRKRPDVSLAAGLADRLSELGLMLPATPLQHLLVRDFGSMLVMTSGNIHDEPIQIDDAAARVHLAGVADAFIGHNRPIRSRYDDSVVRVIQAGSAGYTVQMIRRARGYAPRPLKLPACLDLPASAEGLLATGPEQKNTFCLTRGGTAFVSQHMGDMENAETFDAWSEARETYQDLFQVMPRYLACDEHPEYLTSKWAAKQRMEVYSVQHHHAHIVSAMGEYNLAGPVCGIAFDGTGYGEDGRIWGGEVMLANLQTFERFANFAYVPMPGGAAAIKNPLRMAYGVLYGCDLLEHPAAAEALAALGTQTDFLQQMIDGDINTPYTSSVGRLFDAASALLGICTQPTYEGEGAVLLEAAVTPLAAGEVDGRAYLPALTKNIATHESTALDTSVLLMDSAPVFQALLDDKAAGVPVGVIARRFHHAFIESIIQIAQVVDQFYGIRTVVLSGGVFMNRYLVEHALAGLEEAGFTAVINCDLPPNDACISYGQAVVAWARRKNRP